MAGRCRASVSGPLGGFVEGFLGELAELGYSPRSYEWQLRLLRHLSEWLAAQGLATGDLITEVVGRFLAERRRAGAKMRSERALAPLLGYLRRVGVAPDPLPATPESPAEVLAAGFVHYSLVERGLDARTVAGYVGQVGPFLAVFPSPDQWQGLTARQVSAFVTQRAVGRCGASIKAEANALRALLRWMWLERSTSAPMAEAVGSFAADRGTRPPQALSTTEVAALRAAVTERADHLRNEAMVALMLRLGLRAGEVAALRLEDIDWQSGLLRVRGKGSHLDALPLPVDVGEALAAYVMEGRPPAAGSCQVFLRSPAPHTGLSVPAVSLMVSAALLRGGVTGSGAAHRLRHTAACGVLAAGGGLIEAGQLLRHTRVGSTAIYAKADLPALRGLARPWPTMEEGQ